MTTSPVHFRSGAKVTLYEKENVFGGHTLTNDSSGYPVDLGFQVLAKAVLQPRQAARSCISLPL